MSSASVGTLPLLVPLVAPGARLEGGRVVLTGAGGGTYDLGDQTRRRVVLVADVVDYCRLAARRLPAAELEAVIEGDEQAAAHLLAAAQLFAI
jgi:alpha-D-ribose 1-methylphosphonate 5-triphosphate synthase subunit PhnG